MDLIEYKFNPHQSWIKLDKNDYSNYAVVQISEAEIVSAYKIGSLYNFSNTVVLYNYGKNDGFLSDLEASYNELQHSIEEQDELGVFPVYWESFGDNKMLSILKLITHPVMNIVDIFFEYNDDMYCFHTYIKSEEKKLDITNLSAHYPNIRHIINEINNLQN